MRLLFVRHGETIHNVERRIQGPLLDDPLNARGVQQAAAMAKHLAAERDAGDLQVAAVYSSPLKRAWMTAESVAGVFGLAPIAMPELVEFSWGIHLGKTETGETLEAMKVAHREWSSGNVAYALPEGESPATAWERARAGLWPVLSRHPRGDVALVAHGRINKIVLGQLVLRDISRMDEFPQANTSLTLLERDDGAPPEGPWRPVYVNKQMHLAEVGSGVTARSVEGDRAGPLV
jgi:broad specificity phosphatase PhoE